MTDKTQLLPVTPELLPCPFCGGEPVYFRAERGKQVTFRAYCRSCCARAEDKQTAEEAIAAWNTRISHSLPGDVGRQDRLQKYIVDEAQARERLDTFSDAVRQRLTDWQKGQSEWFACTILEIVAEFIAFDDAARAGEAENKAGGLWYRRWHTAQTRVNELEELLANPPKHKFWRPGQPDCPRDIKAANGELHTLRCRVCGLDNPSDDICRAALTTTTPENDNAG